MIPPEFLAAIIAERADNRPRLILADWLDGRGDEQCSSRAELIRLQLAYGSNIGDTDEGHREVVLLETYGAKWAEPVAESVGFVGSNMLYRDWGWGGGENVQWQWSRGFISTITCSWSDWLRHCDSILKATPLERVRLTTMPEVRRRRSSFAQHEKHWDYTFANTNTSPTYRKFVSTRELSASRVDLPALYEQRERELLLERAWPGIEFELPHNETFSRDMIFALTDMVGLPAHLLEGGFYHTETA